MTKEAIYSKCERRKACIDELMQGLLDMSFEITDGVSLTNNEWKIYYRLRAILHYYPDPQPPQVGDDEALAIEDLKEHHGYSVGDLAFIFIRSKATIPEVLNRKYF
jgi:hypothetical protein